MVLFRAYSKSHIVLKFSKFLAKIIYLEIYQEEIDDLQQKFRNFNRQAFIFFNLR
jgi:hypothetical protein